MSLHELPLFFVFIMLSIGTGCGSYESSTANPAAQNTKTDLSSESTNSDSNKLQNDKKEGLIKENFNNGQLKKEGEYKNGLKEGLHKEYWENGILSLEGFYVKGKANGLMKWFHEKGHIAATGNMVNGKRDGAWKICDIENASLCIDANFKNESREGFWKIYHENGKLWKEQMWKNDAPISEKCWDENGNKIACE